MALTKDQKKNIIKQYQKHEKDTGSTEIQIALLSQDINNSNHHLKNHPHDYHSNRGLFIKSRKRQKLLKYLKMK